MDYVIQERRKGDEAWRTMAIGNSVVQLSKAQARHVTDKIQAYFGMKYEYRIVERKHGNLEVRT